MNLAAISHRSNNEFTYAIDNDNVQVTLRTGKDIDRVVIICEDPFIHELNRKNEWYGNRVEMEIWMELTEHYIWRIILTPKYKRLQYYFEIISQSSISNFHGSILPTLLLRRSGSAIRYGIRSCPKDMPAGAISRITVNSGNGEISATVSLKTCTAEI